MDEDLGVLTLENELRLVRSAVALVASGASDRVALAGLSFGEELVPEAQRLAQLAGVRASPIWTTGESGADLVVERASDA